MTGYHISFFRHGLTEANNKGIYIGRTDYPLSERGRSELAEKLDRFAYPRVEAVYTSPLQRCTETAEILFPDRELREIPELQELDFGAFEGKRVEELLERDDYKAFIKGGMSACPPGGESVEQLCARTYRGLSKIIQEMMQEDMRHCAVVTHAGIISNLIAAFGLPKLDPKQIACAPGEGFEVLVTAQLWQQGQAFEILGVTPFSREEE